MAFNLLCEEVSGDLADQNQVLIFFCRNMLHPTRSLMHSKILSLKFFYDHDVIFACSLLVVAFGYILLLRCYISLLSRLVNLLSRYVTLLNL